MGGIDNLCFSFFFSWLVFCDCVLLMVCPIHVFFYGVFLYHFFLFLFLRPEILIDSGTLVLSREHVKPAGCQGATTGWYINARFPLQPPTHSHNHRRNSTAACLSAWWGKSQNKMRERR